MLIEGIKLINYLSKSSEAVLFIGKSEESRESKYLAEDCQVVKIRLAKEYRNDLLDTKLRRHRTKSESKILRKCNSISGLCTPKIYRVDMANTAIFMEYIQGKTLSELLRSIVDTNNSSCSSQCSDIYRKIGTAVGHIHASHIIHGDLTASNFIVQANDSNSYVNVYLIDFGLSFTSQAAEDRAVDLYGLERCIHSIDLARSGDWLDQIYCGYKSTIDSKEFFLQTMKRLEQVRQRGRKRSMVG